MNGELNPSRFTDRPAAPGDAGVPPPPAVEMVDLIAAAVRACPAVAGLHGGRFGQATTYLPGRRVAGVTVSPTEIVVGVVGRYPVGVAEIAAQVRAAVGLLVAGVAVTVNVEDLALPGETLPGETLPGEQVATGAEPGGAGSPPPVPAPPVPAAPSVPAPPVPVVPPVAEPPAVPAEVGPVSPAPTSGARPGIDPVSAGPPLATPLAPPEKEIR